jgi:hypothetical protein
VNGTRVLACATAVVAVGCLWLYPIPEDKTKSSSSITGMAGSTATAGTAGTSAMTEMDAGECTTNEDCVDPSLPERICRAKKCVQLKSEEDDCVVVLGKWSDPNAFIFGAYSYYDPQMPANSQPIYNYGLAIDELNGAGGLPDIKALNDAGGLPDSGGTKHPLAAIVCNNDPSHADQTLHHLVDEVGVSAIIADLPPKDLVNAFLTTKKENKSVFFLSPGAANDDLLKLDDDGLVWNMIGPPSDLADGYADLVRRVENYVNARSDAGATSLRVAVVLKDDPTDVNHELWTELWGAVKPKLFFNGALATKQTEETYREFSINAADAGTPAAVGDAINAFAPHIVISMTGTDFTNRGTGLADQGVAQSIITRVNGLGGPSRAPWVVHEYPFFILSPINAEATTDLNKLFTSTTVHDFPILFQRFLGIAVAGADDRQVLNAYKMRLPPMALKTGFENYYDSIYYLAYAVYYAGVEPIDGKKIDEGMRLLSGVTPERVGPDGIQDVFRDLGTGAILLYGAGGSKFDTSTGARIDKAGLYCFLNVAGTAVPAEPAEIFDPDTHKWNVLPMYAPDDAMTYPDPCAPGL